MYLDIIFSIFRILVIIEFDLNKPVLGSTNKACGNWPAMNC